MQDLAPQPRTRLGRVERAVGLFVLVAILLVVAGFCYYVYHTARHKGWFLTRARYWTSTYSAAGLKVGDPVKLWGFDVGQITRIDTLPTEDLFNVYVEFEINAPYFGYLWTEGSRARVTATDFLGNRYVEVTRGTNYIPTYLVWDIKEYSPKDAGKLGDLSSRMWAEVIRHPESGEKLAFPPYSPTPDALGKIAGAGIRQVRLADKRTERKHITYVWDHTSDSYRPYRGTNVFWLPPVESPTLTERLDGLISDVKDSLPGVFAITNQLTAVLTNTASLTADADTLVRQAQPLVSNLVSISAELRDPNGSLGRWLVSTNFDVQLLTTLSNVNTTLTNASTILTAANTNLAGLVAELTPPLESLSAIISNLNTQVQANTNFVSQVSSLLAHTDELIQGFKRHWLLRSAFKDKPTNAPPRTQPAARPAKR